VLGTDAADEALDRAVTDNERDVSRSRARRALGANDGRGHEGRALRGELLGSPR